MFGEKNYLGMLAIPILLSMTLGISGDAYAEASFVDRSASESTREISDTNETQAESKLHRVHYSPNGTLDTFMGTVSGKRYELRKAVESGDYANFLVAVTGTPFADIVTEDAFNVLVQKFHMQKIFNPR